MAGDDDREAYVAPRAPLMTGRRRLLVGLAALGFLAIAARLAMHDGTNFNLVDDPAAAERRALEVEASQALKMGRIGLPEALNDQGLVGAGVEVGVQRAEHARGILERWRGKTLYLVDAWAHQDPKEYRDIANKGQAEQDEIYRTAQANVAPFEGRVVVMKSYSLEAAKTFEDGYFDFIYLDARHDRAGVTEDLEAWWPKLRRGGLFSGHDYLDGHAFDTEFGVKTAVDAFALKVGRTVHATSCNQKCGMSCIECLGLPTWWFFK
eukprot:tig00020965_g16878.t1